MVYCFVAGVSLNIHSTMSVTTQPGVCVVWGSEHFVKQGGFEIWNEITLYRFVI